MKRKHTSFAVCVKNEGYAASLERRKIYEVIDDAQAAEHRMIRAVDESGEDYLYPEDLFVPIRLPQPVSRAIFRSVRKARVRKNAVAKSSKVHARTTNAHEETF